MGHMETSFDLLRPHVRPTSWLALLTILLLIVGCGENEPAGDGGETSEEKVPEEAAGVTATVAADSIDAPKGAYEQVCIACHGKNGEGNEELKSPSIAGLPGWYIEEQFRKFREGQRGAHQDDTTGQEMRAIAMSLTEEQIKEAVETVSEMPIVLTAMPESEKNIEKGRYIFANHCMECHRYNGKGEVVFHSAQLISLNRSYIRRQLKNFQSGFRGAKEDDISGNKMVNITSRFNDEQIEMLVDYIGVLAHGDDPRPARGR